MRRWAVNSGMYLTDLRVGPSGFTERSALGQHQPFVILPAHRLVSGGKAAIRAALVAAYFRLWPLRIDISSWG